MYSVLRAKRAEKDLDVDTDKRRGSGRQGRSPVSESLTMSIARVGHVAIPQFMSGNRMFIAWCNRPGCPEDSVLQRWVQPGGLASMGA